MSRDFMKNYKRIVIKIGTNSIMLEGNQIDYKKLDRLAFVCSTLIQEGKEVIIVTSGAVGVGASHLDLTEYPQTIEEQQALAAIGQSILMGHYSRFFQYYNRDTAQILLTRDVVTFETSYYNVKRTMNTLLKQKIVPIINENDAIADDELNHQTKFGDNDTLSAIVAGVSEADLLIIMSDVNGLYDSNPKENPDATLIEHVAEITDEIELMASGKGSAFATGGMATKLKAAKKILNQNQAMIITSGEDPVSIFRILEGDVIGTLFK
ncbi:glutamate 5-kinase [Ruoffia tabacinasalis]|uniref:Glutamate 5-kinase n=1 Tax=Ruoffia tabacinasalis TaxID=87458 RepID=A0A5R9DV13_9LACT|nr:glutamate 5-kinase [Ruoffia tabacinasalis]TLQ39736.1 glutamate 5-kinase [Ruoffia tabacinasalis]